MKLFLITRNDRVGYDQYDSALIRAETEEDARIMASEQCMNRESWLDVTRSQVEEITADDGPSEVVIASYNAG